MSRTYAPRVRVEAKRRFRLRARRRLSSAVRQEMPKKRRVSYAVCWSPPRLRARSVRRVGLFSRPHYVARARQDGAQEVRGVARSAQRDARRAPERHEGKDTRAMRAMTRCHQRQCRDMREACFAQPLSTRANASARASAHAVRRAQRQDARQYYLEFEKRLRTAPAARSCGDEGAARCAARCGQRNREVRLCVSTPV